MAVLEDSIKLIRDSYGEEVDLAHLPQDDPAVYERCKRPTRSACFRLKAARRCRACRDCGRQSFTTSWSRSRSFVPDRSSATWSILISNAGRAGKP